MRVYLVEKDNGESYEDYRTRTTGAFMTHRGASESLLDDGYSPYPSMSMIDNEWEVRFVLDVIEGDISEEEKEELKKADIEDGTYNEEWTYDYGYEMSYGAKIIEVEVYER